MTAGSVEMVDQAGSGFDTQAQKAQESQAFTTAKGLSEISGFITIREGQSETETATDFVQVNMEQGTPTRLSYRLPPRILMAYKFKPRECERGILIN